jgi:hypothetical protein
MNKDKIAADAKKIMDNFMAALDKVGGKDADFVVRRDANVRSGEKLVGNDDFSSRMMKNAPATKDGCMLAEKKRW